MPAWGEFVHDVSIVATLVWVLLVEIKRAALWPLGFALAAAASITPAIADPTQALLALGALTAVSLPAQHRPRRLPAVAILAVGGVVGTLSRTGGPLCDPDSIWQGHGLWHVAAALSLAIWGLSRQQAAGSRQ